MARDVVETICKMDNVNEKYFSILGKLFTNSKNEEEALDWIKQMNKISNFSVDVIDKIASSFGNNLILNTKAQSFRQNALYGMLFAFFVSFFQFQHTLIHRFFLFSRQPDNNIHRITHGMRFKRLHNQFIHIGH